MYLFKLYWQCMWKTAAEAGRELRINMEAQLIPRSFSSVWFLLSFFTLVFRERNSAIICFLIKNQVSIMTLKSKEKRWGCPVSFYLFIFHSSDSSVWWRIWFLQDFSSFSTVTARDKQLASKWNFLIQILLLLLCNFLLSSCPLPLLSLSFPHCFPALCLMSKALIRFGPWKWDFKGLSSFRNAQHDLCFVSVSLCLSVCLTTFLPYTLCYTHTRTHDDFLL